MMNEIILELTAMRSLAHEMSNIPALCDGSSLSTISRSIATLHLLYYHVSNMFAMLKPGHI